MKTCPTCQIQYPDQFAFCQKDGARLRELTQPPPASFSALATQPVSRAVPLGQATNRSEYDTQPVEPSAVTQPAGVVVVAAARRPSASWRWLWLALGGVLLFSLAIGVGFFWYANSTQNKMTRAIRQGQLVLPVGTSAYDYYQQLKREGKTPAQLAPFVKPLPPQLMAKPQQLLADLALPGKRDAAPEAWEEAQRLLAWASEIEPQDYKLAAQASYAAGRAAYLRGQKDAAVSWWKKSLEQDKAWFLPANGLGVIYNERKNHVAARAALQEALKREPNSALPYNNLGTAWLLAKDDAQAEANYRKAAELSPHWPRPHAWLGELALRRKDYAQAVQEFELALSLGATTDTTLDSQKLRQQLAQARKLLEQSAPPPPPGETQPPR